MKDIGKIITLLKKESKNWKRPFLSAWAEINRNPFTTLISCILSLRTKDAVTANASLRLLKKYNTPEKILRLSENQIEKLIYPAGFYKTKARRIREICRVLIKEYSGKVPKNFDELMKLKGVGRKTANIVMVYGFKQPEYLPIDTHCNRIPNRLGWIKTKTPEETENALSNILPKKYWYDFNDLFVQFGQNLCLPVSPFCSKCPIRKYCRRVGVKVSR